MPLCVRLSGVEEMSDVCVCGKCLCVSVGSDCLAWRAPTPKSLDGDPVTVFIRLCSLGLWPLCVCVSDKKAFFVINTSDAGPQIYELVAQTQDARKTWVSQPVVCFLSSSPCLSAHKRVSVCLLSCLLSVRLLENMGLSVCCPVFSVCSLWLFSVTVCIYLTEKMDMLPHHSYVIHVKQVICVHDTMPHMCVCHHASCHHVSYHHASWWCVCMTTVWWWWTAQVVSADKREGRWTQKVAGHGPDVTQHSEHARPDARWGHRGQESHHEKVTVSNLFRLSSCVQFVQLCIIGPIVTNCV